MSSRFEALCKIAEDIDNINKSDATNEMKSEKVNAYLSSLTIDELRSYKEFINFSKRADRTNDFHHLDAKKITAFEYTPINQEYSHQMMFLGNIHYVLAQLENYKCNTADRLKLLDFINFCYAAKEDHIGSIYDLYTKTHQGEDPVLIPDLPEPFLSKIRPSFETWNNALAYVKANFESLRMATTAMFGTRPTQESRIYVHGVFETKAALEEYRLKHAKNIRDILYTAEVGVETILDPYRDLRNNCVVYHPNDKEVELLLQNKQAQAGMPENAMKNRIKKGNHKFISPEDLAVIESYRKAITDLDKLEENDSTIKMKEELNQRIQKKLEEASEAGEVLTKITDMSTGVASEVFVDRSELNLV